MKKTSKAFTLVELLIVIAIIGTLAAVIFASLQASAARARAAKAQAMLSSAIPAMYSCWGNGGKVLRPGSSGGGKICYIDGSSTDEFYGFWPNFSGSMGTYQYSYSGGSPTVCGSILCIDPNVTNGWFVSAASRPPTAGDDKKVCCNKRLQGCASTIKQFATTCDGDEWID